jgi:polyhydroxyalkanoate synthesis regulator phasin
MSIIKHEIPTSLATKKTMKARTLVELAAISSTLYTISKDQELLDKLNQWAEKGKDKINSFVKEKIVDEDGRELDFLEKLSARIESSRKDLEEKVGDLVKTTYDRMQIAHTDKIEKLEHQIENLKKELSQIQSKAAKSEKKEA